MEVFMPVIGIILVAFIIFCIYFIFKQIQFVLVSVNLYKKMVNRQDAIVNLLLDIRDNTKKYHSTVVTAKTTEEVETAKDDVVAPTLQSSPSPIREKEIKQKIKIECPHCHKSEEIRKDNYWDTSELFKVKNNYLFGTVSFVCINCNTKFKIDSSVFVN